MNKLIIILVLLYVSSLYSQENNNSYQKIAVKERNQIDSLYQASMTRPSFDKTMSLIDRIKYADSISHRLREQARYAQEKWNDRYPIYAEMNKRNKSQSNLMKCVGTVQIIGGFAGLITTIIAGCVQKTETIDVPTSYMRTEKVDVTTPSHWGIEHTALTILSSGLILSGSITLCFKY